jgi:hypothetical protein
VELFTPPEGFELEHCFTPALAYSFVEVPDGVLPAPGWRHDGAGFAPPAE